MNAKFEIKKITSDAGADKKVFKSVKQGWEQGKGIKEILKLLENGQLCLDDVESLKEDFLSKPSLADNIQYELYKYCQKDCGKANVDVIVKLAELCYSEVSVLQFNNISRFVGCVYYITGYLLKKEKYQTAVDIMNCLFIKKKEIGKYTEKDSDVNSYLRNLHASFIASSISLALKIQSNSCSEYELSHSLAMGSLKVLKLIASDQREMGKKLIKTSIFYFRTLKHYKIEDVFLFYKTLTGILKVFLPQMSTVEYLTVYIHKMTQTELSYPEGQLFEQLKKTIDFIVFFLNCSTAVSKCFKKILDFFWNGFELEKWISDEELQILNEKHSNSVLYFLLVSSIVSYGLEYVWAKYENNWSEHFSVLLVQKLSEHILAFHKSHCRALSFYCSVSKGSLDVCSHCSGNQFTVNLQRIQYMVRLCFKNKMPDALSLVPVSREAFQLAMESLDYISSRCSCKEKRLYSWKLSVIHHRNTVEDIYRHPHSEMSWLYLRDCSCEIIREIVSSDSKLPFDFKSLNVLFRRWHSASLKLKNYQDALYACIVYYAFYPKEENEIMAMWLQTKCESSNEIFEEITMSELFKTCGKSLREFSKNYNGSKFCLKSVLLMELKAYGTCPPDTFKNSSTSYNLATRIWKQLAKCKLDLWETSVGLFSLISANIAGDNDELPSNFQEKCKKHINDLMNWKRKGRTQCRSILHAANLTFSLFLYNVKSAESSEGKMDTSHMVLDYLKKAEEEKVKFGEDVDLNLTCDVIPSSNHLTVELETNYLNELNKIVDLWSNALRNGLEDSPSPSEFDLWLRNVKQVAHLYELIGEYQRALTTWLMFYKIGKLHNNDAAILLGLAHLIENCTDVDESGIKEEAESVSVNLGSDTTEKYVLVRYFLAVASKYLKNKNSNRSLEFLGLAKKVLEGLRTSINTYILNAKFWCLVSQFLSIYEEYEIVFDYPSHTDVRVIAFKAFSYANWGGRSDLIKSVTQSECTELVLAMLEVNLWAYHLYGVYRQTDFMRLFLDDLYQIVQKLFLPTRTAEMLVRLAEVDMICERLPDCQGKVAKLKSILTTVSGTCSENIKTEKSTSPYLSIPQQTDFEVPVPRHISPSRFLDKRSCTREVDVSPVHFYLDGMKTTKSVEHSKNCQCRLCQNFLIQMLTMNTIGLEAEIYNMENNPQPAAKCYSQACEVLDKLELVRAKQSNVLRLELSSVLRKVPGELDFKLTFVQFQCAKFLIKHALFEASSLQTVTENVMRTMLKVNTLMETFSYEKKLLQWAFAELKLYCVVLNKEDEKPPKKITDTPAILKTTNPAKTPSIAGSLAKVTFTKKKMEKLEKSPRALRYGKISFEDEKVSTNNEMSTAADVNELKTVRKIIKPRKLSFCSKEPETNTKTVKKVTKEKVSGIQSRKLDFDLSGDIFEEDPKEDATIQRKPVKQSQKPKEPPPAKVKKIQNL